MIYAQIKDGRVKNTIILDDESLSEIFSSGFDHFIRIDTLSPQPGVGWAYDGENFINDLPKYIPDVSARQIRQALVDKGVSLSSIDGALASLPDPQKTKAQIEWQESNMFERYRPLTIQVGAMLGWSSDQLDDLWLYAGTL